MSFPERITLQNIEDLVGKETAEKLQKVGPVEISARVKFGPKPYLRVITNPNTDAEQITTTSIPYEFSTPVDKPFLYIVDKYLREQGQYITEVTFLGGRFFCNPTIEGILYTTKQL
ncbi:hypothetical protein HY484_03495 [Candidatus Woesearchaeota archaeon]|nr:hypothetical protein [Candidatus Woesearchaeota archaeon]